MTDINALDSTFPHVVPDAAATAAVTTENRKRPQ